MRPAGWGPAGQLLFVENLGDGTWELRVRAAGPVGEIRTVQSGVTAAPLSRDGRWIAYVSDQGGDQPHVFVRAYDGPEDIRISTAGGTTPRWGPEGDRVYFVSPRGEAMVAELSFENGLSASAPTALPFGSRVERVSAHPDGRLLVELGSQSLESLVVIRGWQALGGGS